MKFHLINGLGPGNVALQMILTNGFKSKNFVFFYDILKIVDYLRALSSFTAQSACQ